MLREMDYIGAKTDRAFGKLGLPSMAIRKEFIRCPRYMYFVFSHSRRSLSKCDAFSRSSGGPEMPIANPAGTAILLLFCD